MGSHVHGISKVAFIDLNLSKSFLGGVYAAVDILLL